MAAWHRLDTAAPADARRLLYECCGSHGWVDRMLARRPFQTRAALLSAARDEWFALEPKDWLEAFSCHPRIADHAVLAARKSGAVGVSEREQAGVDGAADEVLDALRRDNAVYEQRFGYVFIVCATGKRADEMLRLLRSRLDNDPATELRIAADEQAKITQIRLEMLS